MNYLKKLLLISILMLISDISSFAQITNTSYLNQSNEKVLQFSMIVPLDVSEVWKFFSTDSKISQWMAPVAHIELRNGGYILTNYDKTKSLSDSSSIRLGIISYLEKELLILKVDLNNNFPESVQKEDQNLQEIIQFISASQGKTKICSSMIGWGEGKDWEKTYDFFVKGNEWTYLELLKLFK